MSDVPENKQCYECRETKPTSEFHRQGDGFQGRCKSCCREYFQTGNGKESQSKYERTAKRKEKRKKRKSTPQGKLDNNLLCYVNYRFKKMAQGADPLSLEHHPKYKDLPWEFHELIAHTESLFEEGMSWKNYNRKGWWLDHTTPRSHYNYKCIQDAEFQECWDLKNIRPMWAKENCRKGSFTDPKEIKRRIEIDEDPEDGQ